MSEKSDKLKMWERSHFGEDPDKSSIGSMTDFKETYILPASQFSKFVKKRIAPSSNTQNYGVHEKTNTPRAYKTKTKDMMTDYSKSLYKSADKLKRHRLNSAKSLKIHGLRYKFFVHGQERTSNRIKYGLFKWPFKYDLVSKKRLVAGKQLSPEKKNKALMKEIPMDNLYRTLKATDWAKTTLYKIYQQHKRWIHNDESIFSETELKYLVSSLPNREMQNNDIKFEEFDKDEGVKIVDKNWDKTTNTLQLLMSHFNMMFYFEKLKLKINDLNKKGKRPSLIHLEKMMSRCLKIYVMIDEFFKIFKLIDQKQVSYQFAF